MTPCVTLLLHADTPWGCWYQSILRQHGQTTLRFTESQSPSLESVPVLMTVSFPRDAENMGRPIFPQTEKLNKEIEKKWDL